MHVEYIELIYLNSNFRMFKHYTSMTNDSGEFSQWLRHQTPIFANKTGSLTDDLLLALSLGPCRTVKSWKGYSINGYKFRLDRNLEKVSMNNGVCVGSTEGVDYYGNLEDIIELSYTGKLHNYTTILFKCAWIDISDRGTIVDKNYKLVQVNPKKKTPKNIEEPFILSYQAHQSYYTPYPNPKRDRDDWLAAFKMRGRSNIDAPVDENFYQEQVPILSTIIEIEDDIIDENNDNLVENILNVEEGDEEDEEEDTENEEEEEILEENDNDDDEEDEDDDDDSNESDDDFNDSDDDSDDTDFNSDS